MDWSNETVIEFLELLQTEPCIWNPKNKGHKNRIILNDAWSRIKNDFSVPCTVQDLKRKRNSLLTQYREQVRKIKDTTKAGSEADEIYRPSWFAFDVMHNYLGYLYGCPPTIKTEEQMESNNERSISRDSRSRSESPQSETDSFVMSKRRHGMQDMLVAKKQRVEAFSVIDERSNNRRENKKIVSECDLYGQLLAEKLKPLEVDDRLTLMNEVDNLVFKYIMNVRK